MHCQVDNVFQKQYDTSYPDSPNEIPDHRRERLVRQWLTIGTIGREVSLIMTFPLLLSIYYFIIDPLIPNRSPTITALERTRRRTRPLSPHSNKLMLFSAHYVQTPSAAMPLDTSHRQVPRACGSAQTMARKTKKPTKRSGTNIWIFLKLSDPTR